MKPQSAFPLLLAIALAPMVQGIINRTKAIVAGRAGQPLMQPYLDLAKLLRKGAVYSETASWVFRTAPAVGLSAIICAGALIPFAAFPSLTHFGGDLVLLGYLLALGRFAIVLGALDTGSSFEGMGASREIAFAALAEAPLFLALAAIVRETGSLSLTPALGAVSINVWNHAAPSMCLTIGALLIVFLTENARIPVDDPTTHLELTMIHEVMVLDHSGPDFAIVQYSAALKMWFLGAIIVAIAVPWHVGNALADAACALAGIAALGIVTGLIEASMARLRLLRVPTLLLTAAMLSALAFVMVAK